MKKLIAVMATLLMMSGIASAAVQNFSNLKADVPEGWSASQRTGGPVVFSKDDGKTAMSMSVTNPGDGQKFDVKSIAIAAAADSGLSADKVLALGEHGYHYQYSDKEGTAWHMMVGQGPDGSVAVVAICGDEKDPGVASILKSVGPLDKK